MVGLEQTDHNSEHPLMACWSRSQALSNSPSLPAMPPNNLVDRWYGLDQNSGLVSIGMSDWIHWNTRTTSQTTFAYRQLVLETFSDPVHLTGPASAGTAYLTWNFFEKIQIR